MDAKQKWPVVFALGLMALGASAPANAEEGEDEHEVARELYQHGQISSLETVVDRLRKTTTGDVVGVDLIQLSGHWIYRFQVIAPDGHRILIDMDAGPSSSEPTGGDD